MNSNKRLIAFSIYAVALICFPIWMIVNENNTFKEGIAYKFKCAPLDPNDPFRGKYIALRFENIEVKESGVEMKNPPYFGLVDIDKDGFAFISAVEFTQPVNTTYIELNLISTDIGTAWYTLPIDRLYMNEYKAQAAEDLYRNALQDSTQNVYAKVYISDDRYLLDDVFVDDVPLREALDEE